MADLTKPCRFAREGASKSKHGLSNAAGARRMSSLPSHVSLMMPALSPTMTQGNITTYKVKVGDKIAPGDLICDIESDKATIGWESQVPPHLVAPITLYIFFFPSTHATQQKCCRSYLSMT